MTALYFGYLGLIFGLAGLSVLLNRHNMIILLISFEILYLCGTLLLIFSAGQSTGVLELVWILYILTVVGAEACIGLALLSAYYRVAKELSLNTLTLTKL